MTPEELVRHKVRHLVKAVAPPQPGFVLQHRAIDVVGPEPDEQDNIRRLLWFPHRFD